MGFWPVVLNVLRNSDVVLLVVDARVPDVAFNSELVAKVEKMGKTLIVVFNKVDLVSGKGMVELKSGTRGDEQIEHRFFVSATKRRGIKDLKIFLEDMAENFDRASLRVGVVGYPNSGKSSLINCLVPGASLRVKNFSGTTRKTEWLRLGRLRIMDSPGVIPAGDESVALGLTASKDPHKIKNIEKVALSLLAKRGARMEGRTSGIGEAVRGFYGVSRDLDDYEAFLAIGKKKGFLVKGGEIDERRTAIRVVEDWQTGKIGV